MADRDSDRGEGVGGMGAILGMILGVLLVGGLIFFFAGNFSKDPPKPKSKSEAPALVTATPA